MFNLTGENQYANGHKWECVDLTLRTSYKIDGPLAEICSQYPESYQLTYIGETNFQLPGREIERKLSHKCGAFFLPEKTVRLNCEKFFIRKFKYQDLLMGECPRCHKATVFGWLGIDYLNVPVEYFAIKSEAHDHWINRMLAIQRVQIEGKSHNTVTGSVQDRLSGNWQYKETIPVK